MSIAVECVLLIAELWSLDPYAYDQCLCWSDQGYSRMCFWLLPSVPDFLPSQLCIIFYQLFSIRITADPSYLQPRGDHSVQLIHVAQAGSVWVWVESLRVWSKACGSGFQLIRCCNPKQLLLFGVAALSLALAFLPVPLVPKLCQPPPPSPCQWTLPVCCPPNPPSPYLGSRSSLFPAAHNSNPGALSCLPLKRFVWKPLSI
jgi:hypothetical protein